MSAPDIASRLDNTRAAGSEVVFATLDGSDKFGRQLPLILKPLLQPLADLLGLRQR